MTCARSALVRMAAAAAVLACSPFVGAQHVPDIPERARGAERIVVATVAGVTARMERNEFGDELIVSRARLAVHEVLKGAGGDAVDIDVEGGTLNGLTLSVSSLPTLDRGERAVFFLTRGRSEAYRPYLRGLGILKLDPSDTVKGSSLRLEDVRRMTRDGQ